MTRTGEEEADNMYTPPPIMTNKFYDQFSVQGRSAMNSYQNNNQRNFTSNQSRSYDHFSFNNIDDGKSNNKKRNDALGLSQGKLPLQQSASVPQGFLLTPYYTPPDKFLSRSRLLEVKEVPSTLTNGSQWDQLSRSMWKKFLMHRQTEETYFKKIALWKFLFIHIKSSYPKYGLYLVGSTLTGFGSDKSDVDLCLIVKYSEINQKRVALPYLCDILKLLFKFDFIASPELIQAKVPILKFRDVIRDLEVDLNCNNSVGIRNTHLLYCYSQLDWRVRPLVIVVKLWAHFHDINDAKKMTISSYSLTLMVLHFLQCGVKPVVLPCLHKEFPAKFTSYADISKIDVHEEVDPYYSLNTMSIGELLVKFFDYYSNFNYSKNAISVRTGSVMLVDSCRQVRTMKNDPHQWKYLCIEEPFDFTNTARSVYDLLTFERILKIFRLTALNLKEHPNLDTIFKHYSY